MSYLCASVLPPFPSPSPDSPVTTFNSLNLLLSLLLSCTQRSQLSKSASPLKIQHFLYVFKPSPHLPSPPISHLSIQTILDFIAFQQNKTGSSAQSLPPPVAILRRPPSAAVSFTVTSIISIEDFRVPAASAAGVLGLPYSFRRTCLAARLISICLVGALTKHLMMLLVRARRLDRFTTKSPITSFGDPGFDVPGAVGRAAVDLMFVVSQAAFCVSYTIFIANNLAYLFPSSNSFYVWIMLPFQLDLNSIPTLTHHAPLSIFADVVDIGVMGVVFAEDLYTFLTTVHSQPHR